MRKYLSFLLGCLMATAVTLAHAAPAVEEIVNKANMAAYYAGDDGRSEVQMTITDSQGRTRNREFVILRRDEVDGGEQTFYVYFQKPSDVRKTVFLVHKHIDRDDDRWMYLPALDLVKRIAASDKRTSFVGSHFLYEDVSGRTITEDDHELIEETAAFYVLQSTPKDAGSVEFSSYTIWIDKKTYLPMKAEYLNKEGKKYRIVEALEVKDIQGLPTVVKSRVDDLDSGGNTVTEFKEVKYNIGLEETIFTERYLRRPPREVR
ncbi:MAG: outer membrane lipoprotein-sorting protein [Desulfobulbaceae bacterium]|uniref:Outer membrane lipoprotein-sorting protein n=1 Tax=Candidatus Desulfobia pelagia TaxID=2841692 RepID=A0A8J6NCM7_9BACT|nr:outer membrane lipoprotein-sorting protein [Candidatus Desulfobia pelagia]